MTTTKIEAVNGIEVKVTEVVPYELIANAFIGAIEGGSNYWCNRIELISPPSATLSESPWYASPDLYRTGNFLLKVTPDDDTPKMVGKPELRKGLALMAKLSPDHFQDLIKERDDATTHDVLLQYVALGSIVYG